MKLLSKLIFIIVSLFTAIVIVVFIWNLVSFEIKSYILNSIPRYPMIKSWNPVNSRGGIPDTPEIHRITFEYDGDYLDVINYYAKYFITNNFFENEHYPVPQTREKETNSAGEVTFHDSRRFTHKIFKWINVYLSNYNGYNKSGANFRNDASLSL